MYLQHLDDVKLRTEVIDNKVFLLTGRRPDDKDMQIWHAHMNNLTFFVDNNILKLIYEAKKGTMRTYVPLTHF